MIVKKSMTQRYIFVTALYIVKTNFLFGGTVIIEKQFKKTITGIIYFQLFFLHTPYLGNGGYAKIEENDTMTKF